MKTREVTVVGRTVQPNGDVELVRTSVGIDQMHVLFDAAEWVGFGTVKCTFKNLEDAENPITVSLTPTALDSEDWSAEATCTIPWEVIQDVGAIAVTFQATDSNSNHIITARADNVLAVVEAGDVADGTVPSTAPTQSEWEQAYADATAAASRAAAAAAQITEILNSESGATLQEILDAMGAALRYKGAVETYGDLPESNVLVGDVYTVEQAYETYPAGTDFFYTGENWEAISSQIVPRQLTAAEIERAIEDAEVYKDIEADMPIGSKRVEYIKVYEPSQSVMVQTVAYIDTGIPCNTTDLSVEMHYELTSDNQKWNDGFLFGDSSVRGTATFAAWRTKDEDDDPSSTRYLNVDNIVFANEGNEWVAELASSTMGRRVVSLHSNGTGYIDGTAYPYSGAESGENSSNNLMLLGTDETFEEWYNNSHFFRGRVYGIKVWSGNSLLRDFIPATTTNNEACLYDRVSGQFFMNGNPSMPLEAGPEVSALAYLGQAGVARLWIALLDASQQQSIPIASASTLGGVKVGNGLAIDANGVLSLDVVNGNLVSY